MRGSCLLIALPDALPPAAACRPRRQAVSRMLPAHLVTYTFAHGAGARRLGRAESRVGCVQCLVDPSSAATALGGLPAPTPGQAFLLPAAGLSGGLPLPCRHRCRRGVRLQAYSPPECRGEGRGSRAGGAWSPPALPLNSLSCLRAHFLTSLSLRDLVCQLGSMVFTTKGLMKYILW